MFEMMASIYSNMKMIKEKFVNVISEHNVHAGWGEIAGL